VNKNNDFFPRGEKVINRIIELTTIKNNYISGKPRAYSMFNAIKN